MAFIFIGTSLGIGVYAFWDSTRDKDQTTAAVCEIAPVPTDVTANEPAPKAEAKVSQLKTEDIKVGDGAEAKSRGCVTIKYFGYLAKSGKKFDGNYEIKSALRLKIGAGQVIPGMDFGLLGMKAGGERKILIPANLGYGANPVGTTIPPNSDLVFIVRLLSVE